MEVYHNILVCEIIKDLTWVQNKFPVRTPTIYQPSRSGHGEKLHGCTKFYMGAPQITRVHHRIHGCRKNAR